MPHYPEIIVIVDSDDEEVQQTEPISRTMSPEPQHHQPGTAAPQEDLVDVAQDDVNDFEEIIRITRDHPRRHPSDGSAPSSAQNTTRLRGLLISALGMLYPHAAVHVRRMGDPDPTTDLRCTGEVLWAMRGIIDASAMYCVTMGSCGAVPAAGPEPIMGWLNAPDAARGTDAESYLGVLRFGGGDLGRMMMFTVQTAVGLGSGWVLARQTPGKDYTFEECLDILHVPAEMRPQITGFGPKRWVNGDRIPAAWVAKDLSVALVASKIRNIMRE